MLARKVSGTEVCEFSGEIILKVGVFLKKMGLNGKRGLRGIEGGEVVVVETACSSLVCPSDCLPSHCHQTSLLNSLDILIIQFNNLLWLQLFLDGVQTFFCLGP